MLHILHHSPYQFDFNAFMRNVCSGDAVLLTQDAVIAALENTDYCRKLMALGSPIFVLQSDLLARGLAERVSSEVVSIDYAGFVDLTAENSQSITW